MALQNRRSFIQQTAGLAAASSLLASTRSMAADDRPNILWITCEDLSPHIGCYGDSFAHTPNIDRLAQEGVRYTRAFATAPLCTPARSSIITGMFASTLGTHHLRGVVPKPDRIHCFTEFLREEGYYCTNNVKEDYNFKTPENAWDESSNTAHWRKKQDGQPFFSVFNFMTTHQSQTRYGREERMEKNKKLSPEERVNPAEVPLPPYYPDTPIVRENMAAFYTQITLMDKQVGEILDQLAEDGLAENTIVFFYSDHGDGLPRGKRWLHDSGVHVPLVIRFPEKYKHLAPAEPGEVVGDLISFVDFAPTVLRLAGLEPPEYMHGRAFLANKDYQPREAIFAIRDRVDEVLMCSRSIRTERYHYIRNFMPHRPRMQRSFYSERTPIRQEIRRLDAEGKLQGHENWLMEETIPVDELYDTETDPYELHNLADDPNFEEIKNTLHKQLLEWMIETNDLGLMPEYEMWKRSGEGAPMEMAEKEYDLRYTLRIADKIGRGVEHLHDLRPALLNRDAVVRYWGAVGLAVLGNQAEPALSVLLSMLSDNSPPVRFAVAEVLCNLGEEGKAVPVLAKGLVDENVLVQLHASQILMAIEEKAKPAVPQMKKAIDMLEDEIDHGWYTRENCMYMVEKFEE